MLDPIDSQNGNGGKWRRTPGGFIPPHGRYEELLSYRKSLIIYDATVRFCERFMDRRDRTVDQMVQAARSGKQNIIEGSMASGTSKESEIKLMNVARASLEELLEDYRDFLRTRTKRTTCSTGRSEVWRKNFFAKAGSASG